MSVCWHHPIHSYFHQSEHSMTGSNCVATVELHHTVQVSVALILRVSYIYWTVYTILPYILWKLNLSLLTYFQFDLKDSKKIWKATSSIQYFVQYVIKNTTSARHYCLRNIWRSSVFDCCTIQSFSFSFWIFHTCLLFKKICSKSGSFLRAYLDFSIVAFAAQKMECKFFTETQKRLSFSHSGSFTSPIIPL